MFVTHWYYQTNNVEDSMIINKNKVMTGAVMLGLLATSFSVAALTAQEQLGQSLYFDTNLSEPAGQACVSCHDPNAGFADPDQNVPVSEGVIPGLFGGRNSPTASYAVFSPQFTLSGGTKGGQFWDGRAATLAEQAKGPFLNPVEMANTSKAQVIGKIAASSYSALFVSVCGANAFAPANTEQSYNCMANAIAAFEATPLFSPFSSKYDAVQAGLASFTAQEEQGFNLFSGRGKCAHCHDLAGGQDPDLFSDFKFHNIGLPPNPEIYALTGSTFTDLGLGGVLGDSKQNGKFKTSHLRNVERTPPYMHNGVLATLKDVVHFYNTRDIPGLWPAPEVPNNLDSSFVGDLGLTNAEEDAIVAFMLTLTDGYFTP